MESNPITQLDIAYLHRTFDKERPYVAYVVENKISVLELTQVFFRNILNILGVIMWYHLRFARLLH